MNESAELTEQEECLALANALNALSVPAEAVPTGGNCWAVLVQLSGPHTLQVTPWPFWACVNTSEEDEPALSREWDTEDVELIAQDIHNLSFRER